MNEARSLSPQFPPGSAACTPRKRRGMGEIATKIPLRTRAVAAGLSGTVIRGLRRGASARIAEDGRKRLGFIRPRDLADVTPASINIVHPGRRPAAGIVVFEPEGMVLRGLIAAI